MTPEAIAEVSSISGTIVDALREAHEMARQGRFGDELNELVRHAREMCDLLVGAIGDAGVTEPGVDDYARSLAAGLENMERVIAGHDPH
jgi:hypothetical protein